MSSLVVIGVNCPFCDNFIGERHPEISADELEANKALIKTIMFRVQNEHITAHAEEMAELPEGGIDGAG